MIIDTPWLLNLGRFPESPAIAMNYIFLTSKVCWEQCWRFISLLTMNYCSGLQKIEWVFNILLTQTNSLMANVFFTSIYRTIPYHTTAHLKSINQKSLISLIIYKLNCWAASITILLTLHSWILWCFIQIINKLDIS